MTLTFRACESWEHLFWMNWLGSWVLVPLSLLLEKAIIAALSVTARHKQGDCIYSQEAGFPPLVCNMAHYLFPWGPTLPGPPALPWCPGTHSSAQRAGRLGPWRTSLTQKAHAGHFGPGEPHGLARAHRRVAWLPSFRISAPSSTCSQAFWETS